MRSAATRTLFCLLLLGGLSGSAAAGPLDPVQTIPSVNDTVGTATGAVSGATGAVSGPTGDVAGAVDGATGAVSGAVDGATGAAGSATQAAGSVTGSAGAVGGAAGSTASGAIDGVSSGGSTLTGSGTGATLSGGGSSQSASNDGSSRSAKTTQRGSRASNPRSPRTAFDRLPRRYEALLERIQSGRHVRANIARLRALLASASPQLRARILRLIGLEIRRLERGGLTRHERAMIERLQRLRAAITTHRSQPASQRSTPPLGSPGVVVGASQGSVRSVGANAAFGLGGPPAKTGATERGKRLLPLPAIPGPPYWLPALLALLACGLLLIVAARRRVLPANLRGALAEHGGAQLSALAVTVGLILVVAVAFMIQALLP